MVEKYLNEKFNKTKFPYVLLVSLYQILDEKQPHEVTRNELNILFSEGKIRKRPGMHGTIIEIL